MYIRRTTIKSRKNGEPYCTYRLVESVRTKKGVRQHTILNLGRHFPYPRDKWSDMVKRIDGLLTGQTKIFPLSDELETATQRYAALIIESGNRSELLEKNKEEAPDYRNVNVESLELLRPRSVGIEHVAYETMRQLSLDKKLKELGFNKHHLGAAIGTIIGRIAVPGSELATFDWLQNRSGLGELIDYDYEKMNLTRMYRASDMLYKHKEKLEAHLYGRQRFLFTIEETITLYDLTNTYFEGSGKYNKLAAYGRSKDKRSDCP